MFYRYYTFTKVKDILRTFEPDNHKLLRTSQPQNVFAGPYKKKVIDILFKYIKIFVAVNILTCNVNQNNIKFKLNCE